ncbi:16S rRNA (guanine(966)-N(2))-methyltransferase RsmD [Congregibacter variabilis]|uniref:Ribosomal RNA small subunit methyltransferase D n=1 Tax=Congregibacter variabilis TaxID=3081200 RepID=A0ABZ0HYS3_9GAMM|nr:16S rRNA (guanine(966)-N(2))-methyltransferase RsmD [Congregibacter sp. IMCC43200]
MGATKGTGQLRIIAGQWRGRKLPVANLAGLRPSTDRIRETLFNWLSPDIVEARCLDLFAGTGALGLEALSRGAAYCQFVENQAPAAHLLRDALVTLQAGSRGEVLQEDATRFLARAGEEPFDLVFLDPPFASNLLETALNQLTNSPLLSKDALIYLEYAPSQNPDIPANWEQYRSKKSAGVIYELYRRESP